ncbi:hypothetical protein RO3G_02282 [Rhizopus delemar RA 99-880]|uniref:Uncharacterized protein n=1 Tax=Rhizopus delemar (strain RA 99-880 / ATCC MYA-4621 / FGSC 9543 / NRRL 43880) TaxID=246409 RepID=I1BMZ8_RHIO9|nr:hypothetical protein RO3G_02282 [Rhizopus delemar RA 99-880]|eukprot:EIE77578.1 hypothetical protein RO3G_02282 [Rhizopus delemar RA 99-880]
MSESGVNQKKQSKSLKNRSPMGTPNNRNESEVWTKDTESIYPYSPFPGTAHEKVLSNRYQILKEVVGYRVYGEIDDTIKTGLQAKQPFSKKVTTLKLVFVTLPMMVEIAALETTEMI